MFAVSIAFAAPSQVLYLPFSFTLKVAITPSLPVNGESLSEKASACSVLPFIETPIWWSVLRAERAKLPSTYSNCSGMLKSNWNPVISSILFMRKATVTMLSATPSAFSTCSSFTAKGRAFSFTVFSL